MDEEKKSWLKSIGAGEFPEPVKYIYTFPGYNGAFNLSERYIEETPLKELKAQYKKNKSYAKDMIKQGKLREKILKKSIDAPSTLKIYEHYGAAKDYEAVKQGNYKSVDFLIGREEDIKELTADMAGFGTNESQRIIIDYDKSYGWFIAKRIPMNYGTFNNAPLKTD